MNYKKFINDFNVGDTFAINSHIHLTELEEGRAVAVMDADERNFNFMGSVHGGAVYTLVDVAAGTAAVSFGMNAVTLSASVNFLLPGQCGEIKAIAEVVRKGRKIIVCSVNVYDKHDKLICNASVTMFATSTPIE